MRIPSGKTDVLLYFVAVDSTDLKTRKTGLSGFSVYRSRNGGAATAYTTPTVAELSAANMPGVYALTIDEDTTIASTSDSEEYAVHITVATMNPVTRTVELYRRDTTTGRTLSVDASSRALADVDTIKTNPVVNGGTITFPTTATLASTTNITAGTVTTATNVTTVNGLAANVITAAATAADFGTEIAAAVWQDAVAGDFTVASSIGKALYVGNIVPGAAGGHFIAGTNAATSITTALTANITGNVSGSVGSVTGAVGSVTGAVGSVTGAVGSVTGAVGSVTADVGITQAGADKVWSTASRVLTAGTNIALAKGTGVTGFNDLDAAGVAAATWNAATATYGSAGSYGLLVETNLDAAITTRQATLSLPANFSALSITAGGLVDITQDAADKSWSTAARVLTAGTNIALAKGVGITGFNDLDAAGVATATWNAETATYGSAGSYGLLVETNLDAAITTRQATLSLPANFSALSITAGGLVDITQAAADKAWSTAARVLTAGTNIVLAKGVGLTGLTDLSAAQVENAVWDATMASHVTGGTTGATLNGAGAAGDPWATTLPGAYGAGTAGKIVGDNLNATVSSRATQTSVDDLPTNAELATALGSADDAVLAVLGTPAGVSLSADVAAVKAQTAAIETDTQDLQARLPAALVSGRIDASVGAMAANTITASALATDAVSEIQAGLSTLNAAGVRAAVGLAAADLDTQLGALPTNAELATALAGADDAVLGAIDALPTALENADALLNRDMAAVSDSNARSPLQALRFIRNKWSVDGATLTVRKEDDLTEAWTAAVTTSPGAEPVTGSDPA